MQLTRSVTIFVKLILLGLSLGSLVAQLLSCLLLDVCLVCEIIGYFNEVENNNVTSFVDGQKKEMLEFVGVTFQYPPYVWKDQKGEWRGFSVELMEEIGKKMGVAYTLAEQTRYGIIGLIEAKKADFAIGNIDNLIGPHCDSVDQTTPLFLDQRLAAIVSANNSRGINSVKDILEKKLQIGCIGFEYLRMIEGKRHPVEEKLHSAIWDDLENLVENVTVALEMVRAKRFGILLYESQARHLASTECDIRVVRDEDELLPRQLVIYVQKGSKYLEGFNRAIRELVEDGRVQKLREKYWSNKCGN